MKKFLLSLGLGWMVLSTHAQLKEPWYKGQVVLTTGEHLEGEIIFAADVEVVSLKMPNGTLKAFNASQVESFVFWDNRQNFNRRFKTSVLPDSKREEIVEVVFDGPLEVLRCIKYSKNNRGRQFYNFFPEERVDHNAYRYYVHNGLYQSTMEEFLRKSFHQKTILWRNQLEVFRARNGLDNSTESWLRLFEFFNALEEERILRQLPFEKGEQTELVML
ncbi:hypothetical protein GVN20_05415 [Runella sp. CRIBMP]|uniref:hypothetical protein n=1 Tax=Runella sp. CRIBMP TaxID=2683261 RepID=UPI001411F11A|nr:hypothetical protein [Runella sp. CRIBMP]NBB18790.1 hypothetical protein [Runella sp. CRIBMP]